MKEGEAPAIKGLKCDGGTIQLNRASATIGVFTKCTEEVIDLRKSMYKGQGVGREDSY